MATSVEDDVGIWASPEWKAPSQTPFKDGQSLETSEALQLGNSCDVEQATAIKDNVFDGVQLEMPQGLRCYVEVMRKHCLSSDENELTL